MLSLKHGDNSIANEKSIVQGEGKDVLHIYLANDMAVAFM
jgi:hypothetical protein